MMSSHTENLHRHLHLLWRCPSPQNYSMILSMQSVQLKIQACTNQMGMKPPLRLVEQHFQSQWCQTSTVEWVFNLFLSVRYSNNHPGSQDIHTWFTYLLCAVLASTIIFDLYSIRVGSKQQGRCGWTQNKVVQVVLLLASVASQHPSPQLWSQKRHQRHI